MINYLTEVARSYNDEQITLICEEIDRSNPYDQKLIYMVFFHSCLELRNLET